MQNKRPDVVFLMETKVESCHLEAIKRIIGFEGGLEVGVNGRRKV